MKRTVQILMIVAVAIMALTMVATLFVVLFQNAFVKIYGLPAEAVSYFAIPFAQILRVAYMLVATILLCVTINNQKCGILFEIIFLGAVLLILPIFTFVLQFIEPLLISAMGVAAISKNSYVNTLCNQVSIFYPIAYGLSLISCGMSIGRKCTKKSE